MERGARVDGDLCKWMSTNHSRYQILNTPRFTPSSHRSWHNERASKEAESREFNTNSPASSMPSTVVHCFPLSSRHLFGGSRETDCIIRSPLLLTNPMIPSSCHSLIPMTLGPLWRCRFNKELAKMSMPLGEKNDDWHERKFLKVSYDKCTFHCILFLIAAESCVDVLDGIHWMRSRLLQNTCPRSRPLKSQSLCVLCTRGDCC